jgi:small conductance mechanosensitive channel
MSRCLLVIIANLWLFVAAAPAAPISGPILKQLTASRSPSPASTQPAADNAAIARLSDTTLGQVFQGKKTLTAGEAMQVSFWLHAGEDLVHTALNFLPRLVVAVIVFLIFYGLYRLIRRLVMGSVSKAHVDASVRDLLGSALKWGIVGFGFIAACNQVGIQIGGLLAGTAIVGLAIGFAAQETLANLIACLVIFWDQPFKVGDWIDVDTRYGRVMRITFRSTRLVNGDGEVIVIPNTMMLATKVVNRSTNDLCRVKVAIHVSYRTSIDNARSVLLSLTENDSRILGEPAPSVWVSQCGDHAVHLALGFWIVDESAQRSMESEYLEKAKKAFDAANIEIPAPRMQLSLENAAALEASLQSQAPLRRAG